MVCYISLTETKFSRGQIVGPGTRSGIISSSSDLSLNIPYNGRERAALAQYSDTEMVTTSGTMNKSKVSHYPSVFSLPTIGMKIYRL